MGIRIFGDHDADTVRQLENCVAAEAGADGVLCADGHLGYSMPIGGVVAYREHLSPSGVGYDIACGNKAARTTISYDDVAGDLPVPRPGHAREVAAIVAFLASPEGAYTTGQSLVVDGGMSLMGPIANRS